MKQTFPETKQVLSALDAIIAGSDSRERALKETASLLAREIDHYNWVGFYLVDEPGDHLVLGPFVGAPTEHARIAFGSGVCGQVAVSKTSRVIQDVSQEDNYLACSLDVQSEVVFPIMKKGVFVAELDIDSHSRAPFTDKDNTLLEAVCKKLELLF